MNWDSFQGKFKQLEGAIREQWAKLSTDDMELIAGRRERLAGRIQERYGIARDAAEKQADEWWERIQRSWAEIGVIGSGSVWATSVESLYRELTLPKPAPASVCRGGRNGAQGIALLIKTLAIVSKRNSFERDRDELKTLTEAAQRESSKLAEVAADGWRPGTKA